jgi:D-arabinose 1-dehydrogenase
VGSLGDFHPAPAGLREAALKASEWVESRGDTLASLALRFAISRLALASKRPPGIGTIFGGGSIWEIDANLAAAEKILGPSEDTTKDKVAERDARDLAVVRQSTLDADRELISGVRSIFGQWLNFSFTSPDAGWDVVSKTIAADGIGEKLVQEQNIQLDAKL